MNHAIIDMIIRIKNGYMARRDNVVTPGSQFRREVLTKLQQIGYIEGFSEEGDVKKTFDIELKYKHGEPAVTDVKLFSKPGQRHYVPAKSLKPVLSGMGYAIVSTPKGVMTNIEAKKANQGGELLFEIW